MATAAVEVGGVSKAFRLYAERNQSLKSTLLKGRRSRYDTFTALDHDLFQVPAGATFGIVGSNGSGKSTLLKCIARILVPDTGIIRTWGSVASLLELGSGFHGELTGRENVYLNASIMRIPRREIDARLPAILDFAGIGDFIDQPVKTYSSGMYVRLGFSVAAHLDPDILLVDEVIAVGDADFQDKCLEKFADFRRRGRTVIVASHALGMVEGMCDEVCRLDHGRIVEDREISHDAFSFPQAASADEPHPSIIAGVDVLDRHGFAVSEIRTGEPVTLRLHFDLEAPLERPGPRARAPHPGWGLCTVATQSRRGRRPRVAEGSSGWSTWSSPGSRCRQGCTRCALPSSTTGSRPCTPRGASASASGSRTTPSASDRGWPFSAADGPIRCMMSTSYGTEKGPRAGAGARRGRDIAQWRTARAEPAVRTRPVRRGRRRSGGAPWSGEGGENRQPDAPTLAARARGPRLQRSAARRVLRPRLVRRPLRAGSGGLGRRCSPALPADRQGPRSIGPRRAHAAAPRDASPLHSALADAVYADFDAAWYVAQYPEVAVLCAHGDGVTVVALSRRRCARGQFPQLVVRRAGVPARQGRCCDREVHGARALGFRALPADRP